MRRAIVLLALRHRFLPSWAGSMAVTAEPGKLLRPKVVQITLSGVVYITLSQVGHITLSCPGQITLSRVGQYGDVNDTAERPFVEQLVAVAARDLGWWQDDAGTWNYMRVQIRIELEDRGGSTVVHVTSPAATAGQLFARVRARLSE